ncbi:MAG: hypothetical protein AAB403_00660, partial [Planctomycetota bacterium]
NLPLALRHVALRAQRDPGRAGRQESSAKIIEVVEALRSHGWKVPCDRPPFDYRGAFAGFTWGAAPRLLFLLNSTVTVIQNR